MANERMEVSEAIFTAHVAMKVRKAVLKHRLTEPTSHRFKDQIQQDIDKYAQAIEAFEEQFARELYEYRQKVADIRHKVGGEDNVGLVER